jgi:cell shape-determining protein MreC
MNYRLDKKNKKKKVIKFAIIAFIIFLIFFFRATIFGSLSYTTGTIFRPVLVFGNNVGEEISNIGSIFHNRKSLMLENEDLKSQILQSQADRANYASVLDENNKLKEILGRKNWNANLILGNILSKKNQSIYSSLIIDIGMNQGVVIGQRVFALGNIPIGRIVEVDANSSKVILFSSPGEKTEVIVNGKYVFMELVGRGGGNFEMILPRDFVLDVGTEVVLPGATPYVLGTVATIISDPRDAFQKALLVSPVNIQELKFVQVEQ